MVVVELMDLVTPLPTKGDDVSRPAEDAQRGVPYPSVDACRGMVAGSSRQVNPNRGDRDAASGIGKFLSCTVKVVPCLNVDFSELYFPVGERRGTNFA